MTFSTTLFQDGNNTGIEVPAEVVADAIEVVLTVDEAPRVVEVPADLAAALDESAAVKRRGPSCPTAGRRLT